MRSVTWEIGMNTLEEGIAKAMMIMDGYPANALFTVEENMKYYDCVYSMCVLRPPQNYLTLLFERFKKALEESIFIKVLPSLSNKNGAPLLYELLRLWENYKSMVKCLMRFYMYLDWGHKVHGHATSLSETPAFCFSDLVCNSFFEKFIEAVISLIAQDRSGQLTDQTVLQCVSKFFVEVGGQKELPWYKKFEDAILIYTANYYSQVAPGWLHNYSSAEYASKVEQCLREEKERASKILPPSGVRTFYRLCT